MSLHVAVIVLTLGVVGPPASQPAVAVPNLVETCAGGIDLDLRTREVRCHMPTSPGPASPLAERQPLNPSLPPAWPLRQRNTPAPVVKQRAHPRTRPAVTRPQPPAPTRNLVLTAAPLPGQPIPVSTPAPIVSRIPQPAQLTAHAPGLPPDPAPKMPQPRPTTRYVRTTMAEVCHNISWDARIFSGGIASDDCYFVDVYHAPPAALADYHDCRYHGARNNCHIGYEFGIVETRGNDGRRRAVCTANCQRLYDDLQDLQNKEALYKIIGLATADPAFVESAATDLGAAAEELGPGNAATLDLIRAADQGIEASLQRVSDIIDNPTVLDGMTPTEVREVVGSTPSGWREETLGRGSQAGNGWVLREYGPKDAPTGRVIRWHPGGGHHGDDPYWRVSSPGKGKSDIIPAGYDSSYDSRELVAP